MNEFSPSRSLESGTFDEAAAEWLVERESGFTPERAEAFAAWCAGDPRRAEAVRNVERTLALLSELPTVRASVHSRIAKEASASTPSAAPAGWYQRFAWVGGLAALLMVALVLWWGMTDRVSPVEHYVADAAALRTLALPDGSVVDINSGSELSVQFTPKERRIQLRRGEAHFQVAHNTARPFIVTAGDVAVRAVGTAFDVRLGDEAVNVLVVEGRVALGRQPPKLPGFAPENASLLGSGERMRVPLSGTAALPKAEQVDADAISALLTWHNPMTSFTEVPLRDVITRFNRRNSLQLVLEDADLGERKIGGMIALDQVEAFVRLLEQDGDVTADRSTSGRIGLRRAH